MVCIHLRRGHRLRALGRSAEAAAAYQASIAVGTARAEAWWSLADLKCYRFDDRQVATMQAHYQGAAPESDERTYLAFALGKAAEDRSRYADSFAYYQQGNHQRRRIEKFCPRTNLAVTSRYMAAQLPEPAARTAAAPVPIFVVGLPRSGSTLVEQILASHPLVAAGGELPVIQRLTSQLPGPYPDALADCRPVELGWLGSEYLALTEKWRGKASFFVDKMPTNFRHLGFISRILPQARIIDIRRQPMAAGFAGYKQLFARGHAHSYGLHDSGLYQRQYYRLMAHWRSVLGSQLLTVGYEALVADPGLQIRRILDHCRLPFDPCCLEFHQHERAVRTPSSAQVRQPIYTSAVAHWRHYEPFLGELREGLGGSQADPGSAGFFHGSEPFQVPALAGGGGDRLPARSEVGGEVVHSRR